MPVTRKIPGSKNKKGKFSFPFCGAEGDRTPDLVNAIHALSQLSYSPNELETIYEDALLKSTNDRENL